MVEVYGNRDSFGVILSQIIKKSNELSDIKEFLDFVLDTLLKDLEAEGGAICFSDDSRDDDLLISRNIENQIIESSFFSFQNEDMMLKEDFDIYKTSPDIKGIQTFITSIPIVSKNNMIGCILLKSNSEYDFDPMKTEGLKTIGQSIGIAIEKVRLEEKLKVDNILLKESLDYNKKISEYFANLSHELRTPLNILINVFPLIEREVKSKKFIKIAKQNSYRLLRLINNIIDISKMEANFFDIDLGNYNIVSIIEDITQSIAEYVKIKDINIVFDTDIEEKVLACDPYMIERVILNLLSNSIKSIKDNGEILVKIHNNEDRVSIKVKDNGCGIPKEKIRTIFDRFSQVDPTSLKNIQSSGIGLSLVKSIVELHGGIITVNSELDVGTEFTIELPVHTVKERDKKNDKLVMEDERIERITVELSDIYGINND